MIRDDELEELKRLANDATEGPWHRCLMQACRLSTEECCNRSHSGKCASFVVDFMAKKNLEFVIAARNYMADLVAEVKYYRERLAGHNDDLIAYDVKVKRLEKETDWIAQQASRLCGCVKPENMNNAVCSGKLPPEVTADDCVECWRKQARMAVKNDQH